GDENLGFSLLSVTLEALGLKGYDRGSVIVIVQYKPTSEGAYDALADEILNSTALSRDRIHRAVP
ncbi:MAG: hypothetical protein ACRDD1_04600, partial [Planctomycetia bacterium]